MCINADASLSADGSAYAELGNTKIYCVVNGPHEISKADSFAETSWRASLFVKVTYAPFAFRSRITRQRSDQETAEEKAYTLALTDAFTPLILLDKYPRSQIDLVVTVIEDDGGVLPLALTACSVALVNAGIEIYDVVVAASLIAVEDFFIIDPTLEARQRSVPSPETNAAQYLESAQITFGLMPSLNQVVCVSQEGQLKPKNFSQAMKLLADFCYRQYPVVQEAIVKSIKRDRKVVSAHKQKK